MSDGQTLTRMCMALAAGQGNLHAALAYAEKRFTRSDLATRALSTSQEAAGGVLVDDPIAQDFFVSALRPRSVVRRLGAQVVPMGASRSEARVDGGATVEYVGEEGGSTKVTTLRLGALNLSLRKMLALIAVSNPLLRYSPQLAELTLRRDLLEASASTEDRAFLRGLGTVHAPKGLRYWAPPGNVITANATVNFDNVVEDLEKLMAAVEDADVPMRRPGWVMSNRTRRFLATLRDGAGSFAFKDELARGQLFGWAVGATNGIPDDLGGGSDESEVYLVDFAEVAIGQGVVLIDASHETAYLDDAVLKAAFHNDQTVIRLISEHDITARHGEAVAVLTAVTWGA